MDGRSRGALPSEVDEAAPRVGVQKFYAYAVAYVESPLSAHHSAFDGRIENADEYTLGRNAGDDCGKLFSHAVHHGRCGYRFCMARSTLRAASSFKVQFVAMDARASSE